MAETQEAQLNQNSPQNAGQSVPVAAPEKAPPAANTANPVTPQKPEDSPAKKTGRTVLILLVVLCLLGGAGFWYYLSTFTESTDDFNV